MHNSLKFYNNNAEKHDGGALHLITFSQIIFEPETHLDFVNNTGRYIQECITSSSKVIYFITDLVQLL